MELDFNMLDANTVAEVSKLLEDRIVFFTADGPYSIGPDHPQYSQAEAVINRRAALVFGGRERKSNNRTRRPWYAG